MTTFSYFSDTVGLAAGEVGEGKRSGACERKGPLWRVVCFMFAYSYWKDIVNKRRYLYIIFFYFIIMYLIFDTSCIIFHALNMVP